MRARHMKPHRKHGGHVPAHGDGDKIHRAAGGKVPFEDAEEDMQGRAVGKTMIGGKEKKRLDKHARGGKVGKHPFKKAAR